MTEPLITVYITNYNYGKYIQIAVNSVINQTFADYEVLIIDDGSSDNSREIIEEYNSLPNFKIIFQKNKGLIVSNNIALRIARGKYIIRLDADDYLDKNALAIMKSELENDNQLGLVFPNYFVVDEENNILSYRKRLNTDDNNVLDNPAHGACTLIRKKFLESIGGYDESFNCQDGYFLWINFISKYKVKNIDTPLFYYRQHGSNLTQDVERILKTRSEIISKFDNNEEIKPEKALAILPIRGPNFNVNSVALKNIKDNKSILEFKIEETLKCKLIDKIVVTTPDEEVIKHLNGKYKDHLILVHRPKNLARFNIGLNETVDHVFANLPSLKKYKAFLTLSIRYPLLKSHVVDNAVKSLFFFNTDSVISVRSDNSLFFQINEFGLKPILSQEKFTKLERDDLYKYSGGLIVTRNKFFKLKKEFFGGKNGHVIIDERSALMINSDISLSSIRHLLEAKNI
jgi:glycosyltransferase involved in cell wall biosynthesis